MSFGEVVGAAVVLIVVATSIMNRGKRSAKLPRADNPQIAAFEAMIEKQGGVDAAADLRALLNAARTATETPRQTPSTTTIIEIERTGSAPVDLAEILAAARDIKRSTAAQTPAPAFEAPRGKKHGEQRPEQHVPDARFDGARPPLAALPAGPSLGAMRPMATRPAMHPQSPLAAL